MLAKPLNRSCRSDGAELVLEAAASAARRAGKFRVAGRFCISRMYVLLARDGRRYRPALPVLGGPIGRRPVELTAEPAREVCGRGEAEEFGNLVQLAFAVR